MKMLYLCRQTNIQCISMIKSTYIFFVFFMLTAVWSCNRPSDMQREHPAVSPTFYADSLRTLGRGIRLIKEEKESLAFPPLDSVFRLPVDDVLTTEELRRLSSESLSPAISILIRWSGRNTLLSPVIAAGNCGW